MEENRFTYDIIAVLGYELKHDWTLASHILPRLKKVAKLYKQKVAPKIAVCGKWSLRWNEIKGRLPTTEANEMKKELVKLGVPEKKIIEEDWSMDTIGNAYYLKTKIVEPRGLKRILVVCADYHVGRVAYIFNKVFGNFYQINILATPTKKIESDKFVEDQLNIFKNQKRLLKHMKRGDDEALKEILYKKPFYEVKSIKK